MHFNKHKLFTDAALLEHFGSAQDKSWCNYDLSHSSQKSRRNSQAILKVGQQFKKKKKKKS